MQLSCCRVAPPGRAPSARAGARRNSLRCLAQLGPSRADTGAAAPLQPLRDAACALGRALGKGLLGAAAAATVLGAAPAAEAGGILQFPLAKDPEAFSFQKTMVEAWSIVTQAYVDDSFNGTQWDEELVAALGAAADARSPAEARAALPALLDKLGDPFTRWMPAKQYQEFRIGSDGGLSGVGMMIAQEPGSGKMVVLAPIKGSPAEQAGIQPGDELLNVDGTSISGLDTDRVAERLRGPADTSVWVKVARRRQEIPGVAGLQDGVEYRQFKLRRAAVELNPVFATTMHLDDHVYGYVRLTQFSQHAADDMSRAIYQLKRDGAEGFILDLRNNPGGLVHVAMEVASLWVDGPAPVFSVQDREGPTVQMVGLQQPSSAATHLPMVVLVNHNSASASEILAGALRDNGRAEVLGEATFGKGKIQSVFELGDGSALFVTVAKYLTPAGAEIDHVGVQPDRACAPLGGAGAASAASMSGIPVGPGASELVIEELETDDCVLSAEALLQRKLESQYRWRAPPLVAATPRML